MKPKEKRENDLPVVRRSFRLLEIVDKALDAMAIEQGKTKQRLVEDLLAAALVGSGHLSEIPYRKDKRGGHYPKLVPITPDMDLAEVISTRTGNALTKLSRDSEIDLDRLKELALGAAPDFPEVVMIGKALDLNRNHLTKLHDAIQATTNEDRKQITNGT